MSVQKMRVSTADPDGNWLYRVGGISAFVFGIAYVAIIAFYVPMGAPPSGAEALLQYVAGNTSAWWAIVGLSVLTDLLLIPVTLALYLALKGINRNAMLIAAAFIGLFILLDLALTWTNYVSLIAFSGQYTAATSDAQRTLVVAAAAYPTAVLESSLLDVYNTVTLSIGILATGWVMLKGVFNKATAYLGVVTGILGIAAVAGPVFVTGLSSVILFASLLTTIWVFFVGYGLFRLGR